MVGFWQRRAIKDKNEFTRSLGALVGIAQGILCDGDLKDVEIKFLGDWLAKNDAILVDWPGNMICDRVEAVLADGIITEQERHHLINTLQQLIGGNSEEIADSRHVTGLAFDDVVDIEFNQRTFCLTGDFVMGPRDVCEAFIRERGGLIGSITKKLNYLVVGGLGSPEWKHGSFGTKIMKAMQYKSKGVGIHILHEDRWANYL